MSLSSALIVLGALVLAAVAAGVLWRAGDGRRRASAGLQIVASDLPGGALAARATLVQFSTELCARCPQAHRMLAQIASAHDGVEHVDVDLTDRADLAARYRVLQTPTTFVADADGRVLARFNGVPRRGDIEAALAELPAFEVTG